MKSVGLVAALAAFGASAASAGIVPMEEATLGKAQITLHVHDFLKDDELAALRLVLVNSDALALFVPKSGGHAAMAVSPDEGFIRDGALVKSAVALADLPDAATAQTEAVKACDALRKGKAACVVVLEVAPKD